MSEKKGGSNSGQRPGLRRPSRDRAINREEPIRKSDNIHGNNQKGPRQPTISQSKPSPKPK